MWVPFGFSDSQYFKIVRPDGGYSLIFGYPVITKAGLINYVDKDTTLVQSFQPMATFVRVVHYVPQEDK
jgi:hypothetical protein